MKRKRLTVKQILNRDIADTVSLSPTEIRRDIQTMSDAINKRIKRFNKADVTSPALRRLYESGGRVSSRGLSDDELISEYKRAYDFLNEQTSSLQKFEKIRKDTQKEFMNRGVVLSKEDFYKISNMYEELKDSNIEVAEKGFRYWARGQFNDVLFGGASTLERAIAKLEDLLGLERGDFDGVSEFFED